MQTILFLLQKSKNGKLKFSEFVEKNDLLEKQ